MNPVESNSITMKVAATFCALIICFSSAFGSDEWTCVGYPKAFCKLYSYVCPGIEKLKTSDEPVCGDFSSCSLYIDTLESTYDKNADGLITKVSSTFKRSGRQVKTNLNPMHVRTRVARFFDQFTRHLFLESLVGVCMSGPEEDLD